MGIPIGGKVSPYQMSTTHCDFCSEFAGDVHNSFHARYGADQPSRALFETQNFRAFPSIGQLVEGYTLIAPITHYSTIDDLPPSLLAEFDDVYQSIKIAMSCVYGPSLCYEHGARGPSSGGCGIYHAHLHIVPFGKHQDPVNELKERFPHKRLHHFADIRSATEGLSPYLFYEDVESNRYLFFIRDLSSQYMRRVLAEIIGHVEWDWRSTNREERLLTTLKRFRDHYEGHPLTHAR